jgi:hypothetical protein
MIRIRSRQFFTFGGIHIDHSNFCAMARQFQHRRFPQSRRSAGDQSDNFHYVHDSSLETLIIFFESKYPAWHRAGIPKQSPGR